MGQNWGEGNELGSSEYWAIVRFFESCDFNNRLAAGEEYLSREGPFKEHCLVMVLHLLIRWSRGGGGGGSPGGGVKGDEGQFRNHK